jgi:hypothetical protein
VHLEVDHVRVRVGRLRERAGAEPGGEHVRRDRQLAEAQLAPVHLEQLADGGAQVDAQRTGEPVARARRPTEGAALAHAADLAEQLRQLEARRAAANDRENRPDAAAREIARPQPELLEALERAEEHVARARRAAEHEREPLVRQLRIERDLAREARLEDAPPRVGHERHHLRQPRGELLRVDLRGLRRQHRREQLEQAQAQRADAIHQLVGRAAERRELREAQRVAQQRELARGQEARLGRQPARERQLAAAEGAELVEEDPRVHGPQSSPAEWEARPFLRAGEPAYCAPCSSAAGRSRGGSASRSSR